MNILISVDALAQQLSANRPRLLDVRWTVTAPDGRAAHRDGHIPGAVYVDLDAELSDHSVTGRGRHPPARLIAARPLLPGERALAGREICVLR